MLVMSLYVFVVLSHLLFAASERADLLALVVMFNCVFLTFSCVILGQVWYLIVSMF